MFVRDTPHTVASRSPERVPGSGVAELKLSQKATVTFVEKTHPDDAAGDVDARPCPVDPPLVDGERPSLTDGVEPVVSLDAGVVLEAELATPPSWVQPAAALTVSTSASNEPIERRRVARDPLCRDRIVKRSQDAGRPAGREQKSSAGRVARCDDDFALLFGQRIHAFSSQRYRPAPNQLESEL